ncbi:MAG: hypothetical protein ACREDR_49025, partial [Blastocatellia bacterium]
QIAEGLEDEADSLTRRARSFEEEEFLLNREIEEHQTEINRLQLRLRSLRAERDGLIGKCEMLRREASSIREDALNDEEELAIESLEVGNSPFSFRDGGELEDRSRDGVFFRRMSVTDVVG